MKKVSINILNYNGKRFIKDCIDSALKQNYPVFEVVFIDNNSNDDSLDYVKSRYKDKIKSGKLKIIELEKNLGFAGGYNLAFRKSNPPYFLLLNNDTKITDKNLVRKLVKKFESSKDIGSVGCVDLPFGSRNKDIEDSIIGGLSIIQTNVFDRKKREELFYTGGVCCLISREKTKKLFEDEYFAYAEDAYLGFNLRLNGLKNIYNYDTYVLHHGAGTSGRGSPLIRFHSEKNRIRNLLYFYEGKTLFKILPLFILHLGISYLIYLTRPKTFFATVKAHLNVFFNIFKIFKKRQIFQKKRKLKKDAFINFLSYKIFTEEVGDTSFGYLRKGILSKAYRSFTKGINNLSYIYCKLVGLKTREILENEG